MQVGQFLFTLAALGTFSVGFLQAPVTLWKLCYDGFIYGSRGKKEEQTRYKGIKREELKEILTEH